MDKLDRMAAFVAVVEEGSFTAAAERLGVSRAAVSKMVAQLESELGARLLNRTTRRNSLTEVGALYCKRCQSILEDVAAAEQAVAGLIEAPRGTLRINAPMSFGYRRLAGVIAAYCKRFVEVHVDLTLADRFVDVVDEGFDLVIRIGRLPDSSLVARPLGRVRRVFCAAPDYLARHGRPRHPTALTRHACLGYAYQEHGERWPWRDERGEYEVPVHGPLRANNGDVLLEAAVAGLGIAFLPTFICGEALARGALERVLTEFEPPPLDIHVLYPATRHLSPKVRSFVRFLTETLVPEEAPAGDIVNDRAEA